MSYPTATAIFVAVASLVSVNSQHLFGIGGKAILCVPETDMDMLTLRYADEATDLSPGHGRTPGFRFSFDSEFMSKHFPGFNVKNEFRSHPYVNTLSGSIGFVGADDQKRFGSAMRERNADDKWHSRNNCPDTVTVPLSEAALYEVRCAEGADYGSLWNRPPDPKASMPDPNNLVVATCRYEKVQFGANTGITLKTCSRILIVRGFIFDYQFQEENANLIKDIDQFLEKKLVEWKENCSTKL